MIFTLSFASFYIFKEVIFKFLKQFYKQQVKPNLFCKKKSEDKYKETEKMNENQSADEIISEDIFKDIRLGWIDNYHSKIELDYKEIKKNKVKYK